ncbi:MAG TPA: c-type cytochrome [Tahibacter sp.]|nr:c-type cytochrome [Tahibacter sp.]
MSRASRWVMRAFIATPFVLLALAVGGALFGLQGGFAPYAVPEPVAGDQTPQADAATLAQGEYLARLGNCATCHTTRGGTPFAGGRAFVTDYGTIHSTNLTPDRATGLGDWSLDEFRHAMRHGVSRHGVLYPVFPYANFAVLNDGDLGALFGYLRSLAPVAAATPPNRLEFPASWRGALVGWRMLTYRPSAQAADDTRQSAQWNRGRYLVDGVGHCAMCHGERGTLGSLPREGYLAGGRIPGLGWYAPPLDERQLARFDVAQLAGYLRSGVSEQGAAYGPMAEVVYSSLRHLTDDDATAMAVYLKSVPAHPPPRSMSMAAPIGAVAAGNGRRLYEQHCADCHGRDGRGRGLDYPPLDRAVSMTAPDPVNAVRIVLYGAVAPTTAHNPRPYSMPPFAQKLDSADVAAIVSYVRAAWGRQPIPVSSDDVQRLHGLVLD